MKKRLIAIVASLFAAMLVWSGAQTAASAGGSGNDWERRPHVSHKANGNDWEFGGQSFSLSRGNDWE